LLRLHKFENRYVPKDIENGDKEVLNKLASEINSWIKAQAKPEAINQINDLFSGNMSPKYISSNQKKIEEKFKSENFDIINWFVISNK